MTQTVTVMTPQDTYMPIRMPLSSDEDAIRRPTRIDHVAAVDIDHRAGLLQVVGVLHADVDDGDVELLAAVVLDDVLDLLSLAFRNTTR